MIQKTFMIFLYFLHYYNNDAFYTPFFHFKNKNYYNLLKSNNNDNNNNSFEKNDLEIDTIDKTFNKNIRLGRSKDEDGKSNIWSVEPKMEVINEEITELNKNILIFGLIISGFLTSLPLFYTLNQYIEKIDY
jgi:hypothetical protein